MTIAWLFQELRRGQKTGTAIFEQDDTVKKVYFMQGDILFASSNIENDRLGEFLLRTGKITRDQFETSSKTVIKTGKKLGAILFEMGILTAQDLVTQVKLQVKEIILSLFNWRQGHCRFDDGPLPNAEIIPLRMSAGSLILEGVRDLDWRVIRKSLPPLKTIIHPVTDPLLLFQDADLEPDYRTVFSLIDGSKSIMEICFLSGMGDFNTLKAIYALLALRLAEKGEIQSEEEQNLASEAMRKTSAAEEKKQAEATSVKAITKEALHEAYNSLERQNHYEVLGIGRGATAKEVRTSYVSLAKLYHPDQHFKTEMQDMKEQLEALFHAIHEAYDTLTNKDKRDQYNLELAQGVKKHRAKETAPAEKPGNREAAFAQFEEGMKRFNVGNYWGAEEALQWAMNLDPGNAEYVFQRGLALSRMPRRGHDAEEYYVRAIELAPKKVEYYLELGNFYVRNGLKAKAMTIYQDALKNDPNSEKIIKAIHKAGG